MSQPFAVQHIDHVVFGIADTARAEAFYRDPDGNSIELKGPSQG